MTFTSTFASAQVNSWISPGSGNWDTASSWSLGVLPNSSQSVMITNSGWKAVAINPSTPINFPKSMSVGNLTILGSTNTQNTLLLNSVGAGSPLVIGANSNSPGSLLVESNSSVVMVSSGLIVNNALGATNSHLGEFEIDGTFNQSDDSEVVAGFLDLTGTYNLTNGMLFVGTQFINGTFNQQGGTNVGLVDMETTNSDYEMFDGGLQGNVTLRTGTFTQHGGTNSAALITGYRGEYDLEGGVLSPGDLVVGSPPQNFLQFAGGGIEQTGGTLNAGNISIIFGFYDLRGGTLSAESFTLTTNTLLGGLYAGHFNQYGGFHTNGGIIMTGGMGQQNLAAFASYTLNGGTLETPFITANMGSFNHNIGTNHVGAISMSNASTYMINSGLLVVDQIQLNGSSFSDNGGTMAGTRNVTLANANWYESRVAAQLGQLQLSSGSNSILSLLSSPCVLQFADSSGVSWAGDGRLTILNWSGSLNGGGAQQLLFGTSASGLTAQQLGQVQFSNPAGLPSGTYPARILSNGEVVPDQASLITPGQVNSWINPSSGNWDNASSWSLGTLPASSQSVQITNAGWKAVAINPSTSVNFPGSMMVSNLFIRGATNTENTLLLNSFGTAVPLTVLNGLTLQDGAQILNFNSGLVVQGGTITVTNSQINQDGGFINTSNATMYLQNSQYNLTNGVFEGGLVYLGLPLPAQFNQHGGNVVITNLQFGRGTTGAGGHYALYDGELSLPNGLTLEGDNNSSSSYYQAGGTNRTTSVFLEPGEFGGSPAFTLNGGLLADSSVELLADNFGQITVSQNGGTHVITNSLFIAGGAANGLTPLAATYNLNAGTLSAQTIELNGNEGDAVFVQSNGTTIAQTFSTHSVGFFSEFNTHVTLAGGTLICSNYTTDDGGATLNQTGGALVVSNLLDFGGSRYVGRMIYGTYTFTGGTVTASNINIMGQWIIGDSTTNRITNSGTFSLSHTLTSSNAVEQLGRFILSGDSTIDLAGSASRLSFANSSGESWSGGTLLLVSDWNGSPTGDGAEQLKFGTDQSGLTQAQLNRISFRVGTNLYSAKILNTGEVVPNQVTTPPLIGSRQGNNLILDWLPGYTLQTATNASGPYANVSGPNLSSPTPPYTNDMTADPQRFFRLAH